MVPLEKLPDALAEGSMEPVCAGELVVGEGFDMLDHDAALPQQLRELLLELPTPVHTQDGDPFSSRL